MVMPYFNLDYLSFFSELRTNNHKKWFDENRKRYAENVRDPFREFVRAMIVELSKKEPELAHLEPKDCMFRINRDFRFSKDKTPYKNQMSAFFAPMGRKDMSYPGLYVELGDEKLGIYGGAYGPDKDQINNMRNAIAHNLDLFEKVIQSPDFVKSFGEIHGEKNARIPKEFKEAGEKQPLIYNKQWYYYSHLDPKTITSENLIEIILEHHENAKPVREFLREAL
jgi:uncharacterized protein (TIGR02453 family)